MHVGDAAEAGRQTLPDLGLSLEPATPGLGATRRLEDGVIGEVLHDRVEVVPVERVGDRLERVDRRLPGQGISTSVSASSDGVIDTTHASCTPRNRSALNSMPSTSIGWSVSPASDTTEGTNATMATST